MVIHSCIQCSLPILIKCICGHCYDGSGCLRSVIHGPNFLRCFIAIHFRHLNIHQYRIIRSFRFYFPYCLGSIRCRIYDKSPVLQHGHCDFLIERIVLCQKNPLSCKIIGSFFFLLQLREVEWYRQRIPEFRHEQRLRAECGNTRLLCFRLDIRPVIRRQNNNRHLIADQLAYLTHNFDSVHVRNHPVDDKCAECIVLLQRPFCTDNRFLSGKCPFRPHPYFLQHGADTQAGIRIIIRHQNAHPPKLRDLLSLCLIPAYCEPHGNNKFASFSGLTDNRQTAAHHIHKVLCDCHSESGPLNSVHCRGFFP